MPPGRSVLELDGVRLEVDARAGARITSLRRGNVEVLSGPDADPENYGSTLWTSPQSDWGWPPPARIDRDPYREGGATDPGSPSLAGAPGAPGALAFVGDPDDALGVRVEKRIAVDRARGAFVLEYRIHNVSCAPRAFAPWEVTRVRPGGLTFFRTGTPSSGTLKLDERPGTTWYAHDPEVLPLAGQKAFADGKGGVLAHAAGGLVYVKRFAEIAVAEQAPGERPIEIYACPRYVELEVQGPYRLIAPGAAAAWFVTWYLRELPGSLDVSAGSDALFSFVAELVASSAAPEPGLTP